jgi:hypothetical protein
VAIGSATAINSPMVGPEVFVNDVDADLNPVPVSRHLDSKAWLRVYMTFHSLGAQSPRLDEWQQFYDCIPVE